MHAILYMGDSFVYRLAAFSMKSKRPDLNLNLSVARAQYGATQVFFHGIRGLHLANFSGETYVVDSLEPNICILDVGGNDLCGHHVDPLSLASRLVENALDLIRSKGVKFVIIMPLFRRDETIMNPKWRPLRNDYNELVSIVNNRLRVLCSATHGVKLWKLTNMTENWEKLLKDGVHFNQTGQEKYFRNIRGAAQFAIRHVHGLVCEAPNSVNHQD